MIALIAIAASRPVWPPKIPNTCSLVLFSLAIPVVIVIYMLKFSKSYPDRVTGEPAAAHADR